MNTQRRVVLSVTAAALLVLAAIVVNRPLASDPQGGWFMYAPDSEPLFSPATSDGVTLRAAAVWLAAIALWLAFSWRLFRSDRDEHE